MINIIYNDKYNRIRPYSNTHLFSGKLREQPRNLKRPLQSLQDRKRGFVPLKLCSSTLNTIIKILRTVRKYLKKKRNKNKITSHYLCSPYGMIMWEIAEMNRLRSTTATLFHTKAVASVVNNLYVISEKSKTNVFFFHVNLF